MKLFKNLSPTACHYILLSYLVVHLIEILVVGVVFVHSYPIGIAGGCYVLFGIYSLYFRQSWLLKLLWGVTFLILVTANAACLLALAIIYASEWALQGVANYGTPDNLGPIALVMVLILLVSDLSTAGFLSLLWHYFQNVEKEEKRLKPDPAVDPTPREISSAHQQKPINVAQAV